MQKLVIANRGSKEQGKSTSIREVFNILAAKYPTNVYIDYGDIMATIQISNCHGQGSCEGIWKLGI